MCAVEGQQEHGSGGRPRRPPSPTTPDRQGGGQQGGDTHVPPMQHADVMAKMVSESAKAVLKSTKKRARKKELWGSLEAEETTDEDDSGRRRGHPICKGAAVKHGSRSHPGGNATGAFTLRRKIVPQLSGRRGAGHHRTEDASPP